MTPDIQAPASPTDPLLALQNIGPAMCRDLHLLGIDTPEELSIQEADQLYARLTTLTGHQADPCVHDVFTAAIYQARTGVARPWWQFSPARRLRQKQGYFPT